MAALRPVGSEKERPMTPDEPQPSNADSTPQQRAALRAPSGFKRALATGVGDEPAPLANDTYAERRAAAIKGSAGLTRSRRHILRDVKAALLHNPVPVLGDARLMSLWQSGDAAAEDAREDAARRETRDVELPAETRVPVRVPDETARSRSVSAPVKQARVRTLTVPRRRAPASPSVGERVTPAERKDAPVPVSPLPVWGTGDPKLQQARERQELKKQNIAKIVYPAPPPVQKKEKKKVSNSRGIAGLFEGDEPVAGWHNEADDFAKHAVDHFASGVATVPAPGFMPLHERLGRMTKKKAAVIPQEVSPPVQEAPSPPVAPPAAERQMVADIIQSLNDFLNAECKEHAFVDERIDLWSQSSDQSQVCKLYCFAACPVVNVALHTHMRIPTGRLGSCVF